MFKDQICGLVITEVNKHLKTEVTVSDVELTFWSTFPNLSVDFNNVYIRDAYQNATKHDTLLYSQQIRLKFNPIDIWRGNYKVKSIQIKPGTIQLKVRENGEVNYDIVKPSDGPSDEKFEFSLENVQFEDVRFSYNNLATGQHYNTKMKEMNLEGDFTEKQFTLHAKSNLHINKARSGNVTLISNKPASFDIDILIDQQHGKFEIPNALVYVSNLPFQIKGEVNPEDLAFEVHSKDIQLVDVANNFSVSDLDNIKQFDGTGKVYFDLFIDGKTESTVPATISCDFGIQNGTLTEPLKNLKIREIHLDGKYSNKGGTEKEFLKLSGIRFVTPGGPFSGDLNITRFATPNFKGIGIGNIDLNMLHVLFGLPYVDEIKGNLGVETNFNVQSIPKPDETSDYEIIKCEGEVKMKNVRLKLEDDRRTFRDLNGALYLRNDEAGLDNVGVKVGESDMAFNGVFRNIISYFKQEGNITADVEVKSKYLDVQDLGTTTKEEKIQDTRKFVMPDDVDGKAFLEVRDLKYENHTFKNLSGNMLVGNRKIHFPNITVRNADADVKGNLTIEERSPEIFHITTNVSTESLQFKPLFREWNNFHQEVIGENNIYGKAQAKVYFEAPFDLRSGIISQSIKSEVFLKIQDGRLKNVDAFKSITESLKTTSTQLAIGKKNIEGLEKKLLDLKFETLENTFFIRNGRLEIPKMLIHTSALDVEVSGFHTFDNKIDYRFEFRFRDLKDKQRISEFGEEVDDETGVRIFMRMFGDMDDPTIVWDKTAKKEQAKENREQEKADVKSILKTEFGLFKSDTAVKTFYQKPKPREEIKIEFGPSKTEEPIDVSKPKKDSKLKNTLKGWKEESENSKKEEFDFN